MAAETKWTPGPWEVAVERRRPNAWDTIYAPPDESGRREVALASCDMDGCSGANARLIAAAPDMAEAIREHLSIWWDMHREGSMDSKEFDARRKSATARLEAALARAEGR